MFVEVRRRDNGFRRIFFSGSLLGFLLGALFIMTADPNNAIAINSMDFTRSGHSATLLSNGKVLIAGGSGLSSAEVYDPATGNATVTTGMSAERVNHTATMLPSGNVLIAGGNNFTAAELYDPISGSFATAGSMTTARSNQTATLLNDGRVLIVGGDGLSSAELYNPATGLFTPTGSMATARSGHTATLMSDGKVLITGGYSLNSADLYDPATGIFTATSNMNAARSSHTATLLPDGSVLIAGGSGLNSAELYNAGMFSTTAGAMSTVHTGHSASLLPNGKVLISGGGTTGIELYDPSTRTFGANGVLSTVRSSHTATLLANGIVLITGGNDTNRDLATIESYDQYLSDQISASGSTMSDNREYFTATLLPNGKVLITGGESDGVCLSSTDLYAPDDEQFYGTVPMNEGRSRQAATLLVNGQVLVTGGYNSDYIPVASAELYDPDQETFTLIDGSMSETRARHTSTLLPNGKVLITGGVSDGYITDTADLYDPTTKTFEQIGSMSDPRASHTATLMPDGKVLLAGGYDNYSDLSSVEVFDPSDNSMTYVGEMQDVRQYHTATLLPNGKVLIAGGYNVLSADLYDPANGSITSTGSMHDPRGHFTATLLQNGKVIVTGGDNDINWSLDNAELYDPAKGVFTYTTNGMSIGRNRHTATLMLNGKILIAGGSTSSGDTSVADLYSATGTGFNGAWQPWINYSSLETDTVTLFSTNLVVHGGGFRGNSEGSSGSANSSPTNYPLVQLQRVDNNHSFFLNSDPRTNWSDSSFTSQPLQDLPAGYYRVTVFADAVPSVASLWSMQGNINHQTLNMNISGSGSVSYSTGESCSGTCSSNYSNGTQLTLTAVPGENNYFSGWIGCYSVNGNVCAVTMTELKNITATFNPKATSTVSLGSLNAVYDGTGKAATAETNPAGLTVIITYNGSSTLPVAVGSYMVVATISDVNYQGSATGTMNIAKADQAITFATIPSKTYGDSSFVLTATANSRLEVSYSSSNQAVATVSGNTVTILGAGTTSIAASQVGDSNYNAATSIPQTLTVNKATSTTALSASINPSISGQGVTFTATVTPSAATGTVHFMVDGVSIGTAIPLSEGAVTSAAISNLSTGSHTITAIYNGDANYVTSPSASIPHTVNAALALSISGTGSGTVNLSTGGSCSGSTCSQSFPDGTPLTLTPVVGTNSSLSGWSGCDSVNGAVCSVTVSGVKNVTAIFALGRVKLSDNGNVSFNLTLSSAYNSVVNGTNVTILAQTGTFAEAVNFNRDIAIRLLGGNDPTFNSQTGLTTINGSITITRGSVSFDGVVID